jgi:hypothetical protein
MIVGFDLSVQPRIAPMGTDKNGRDLSVLSVLSVVALDAPRTSERMEPIAER